jgi:hypothetical protein
LLVTLAVDIHPPIWALDALFDEQAVAMWLPEGIAPRIARPVLAIGIQVKAGT